MGESLKYKSMEELYLHPDEVPWKNTPIDYDAFAPLLHPLCPRGRLLDVGSGFGKNALPLRQAGYSVFGVDISQTAAGWARAAMGQAVFANGSAAYLPFASECFDLVLDVGCLHCMSETDRRIGIHEICRVLKPHGVVYSRLLKPRASSWVASLPFYAETFGLPTSEVFALFQTLFDAQIWKHHSELNYLKAVKR